MIVSIEPEPASEVRGAVLAGLRAFNRQHAEPPDFAPITLAARNDAGLLIGGLTGETGWRWLHIALLWVDDAHRGTGIGAALLARAEAEAIARGCAHSYLDTFDFQARPFYERRGYTVFGVQEDFPPGHVRYYMRKTLMPQESDA